MRDTLQIKKSNNLTLFNPAFIDDYGFTPEEFRVFSRIMRRAYGEGSHGCSESIPNLARSLGICQRLIRKALKVLEKCGAVTRETREGASPIFDFQACEKWKPKEDLPAIRSGIEAEFKTYNPAVERERKAVPQPLSEKTTLVGTDRGTPVRKDTPPLSERTTKGIPIKGNKKGIADKSATTPSPHKEGMAFLVEQVGKQPDMAGQGKALAWMLDNDITLEDIKEHFPRHVADYRAKQFRPTYLTLQKVIGEMKEFAATEYQRKLKEARQYHQLINGGLEYTVPFRKESYGL